jgi:hypothetical protein
VPNVLTDQERDARSPYASWARRARLAAKIPSAKKAQAALEERIGYRIGDDYLRGIEAGTNKPAYELVKKLAELYETVPPPEYRRGDSEGGGDAATLVAAFRDALMEQTRALAEIRLELREARRTAEEERGVIAEILARLEARLELGTEPASNGAGDAGPALRHA